jgi:hypothetical protein
MQWFEMAGISVSLVVFLASIVVITMRWFRHRERMAMIRQGLIPDDAGAPAAAAGSGARKRRGLLLGGLSIGALGLLLLCAAFFVAVPTVGATPTLAGLSSVGLIPLPGLLVAFMGVGLLILYVWAQPTVERRARAAAVPQIEDAELEMVEPALESTEPWGIPVAESDADAATLDVKAPSEDQ